jgi:hypothetical protein
MWPLQEAFVKIRESFFNLFVCAIHRDALANDSPFVLIGFPVAAA